MLDGVDARCGFAALGIRSSLGHLISGWGAAQGKAMPEWHSRCGQLLDTLNSFGKFGGRNIHTACIFRNLITRPVCLADQSSREARIARPAGNKRIRSTLRFYSCWPLSVPNYRFITEACEVEVTRRVDR